MKKLLVILFCTMLFVVAGTAYASGGQEVCPDGGDWVKVDDLSGTAYTYSPPANYTVTDNCYKHSTYVHYGTGATVTADTHTEGEWVCTFKVRGICLWWEWREHSHQYELSHASFKLVYTPPPPVCEDPLANNVGQPLPCTYDPPPPVCEDPEANNQGQPLPCTYDPPPPVCEDEAALNYGEEGECEYAPPPPVCQYDDRLLADDPLCVPPKVCELVRQDYGLGELWGPDGQYATMYIYPDKDGYLPIGIGVQRQLCVLGWEAVRSGYFGFVYQDSCTGDYIWNGVNVTPRPDVLKHGVCARDGACIGQ